MNLPLWSGLVNLLANGVDWNTARAATIALDPTNDGSNATQIDAAESLMIAQASLVNEARAGWYRASDSSAPPLNDGGVPIVVLGPNILASPNGPYASGAWLASDITEVTGVTDPFGGTTASELTDTTDNAGHATNQTYTLVTGQKYLCTFYFKPGTYTGGTVMTMEGYSNGVFCDGSGAASVFGDPTGITNITVTTVGGYFKVTFNYIGKASTPTGGYVEFGDGVAYVGSGQKQRWWGFSIQTST